MRNKILSCLLLITLLVFSMTISCHSEEEEQIESFMEIVIDEEPQPIQVATNKELKKEQHSFDVDESKLSVEYLVYEVPEYNGMKKWESYKGFNVNSKQKQLQKLATTDPETGIRTVNGRYCVALGTHFTEEIGQYFDLILENGEVIPCILGDVKAPKHTDKNNIFSISGSNKCASEFIVDTKELNEDAKQSGDISSIKSSWNSRVASVVVYNINLIGGEIIEDKDS